MAKRKPLTGIRSIEQFIASPENKAWMLAGAARHHAFGVANRRGHRSISNPDYGDRYSCNTCGATGKVVNNKLQGALFTKPCSPTRHHSAKLRNVLKQARAGEVGADMVAQDAIMEAGYSPERAGKALQQKPIPESVREGVRRVQEKQAARKAKAAVRASERVRRGAHRDANEAIYHLINNRYFNEIPLGPVITAVEKAGFAFDPEEIPLFLTGRTGKMTLDLFGPTGKAADHMLVFQWHKLENSGRYEIVAYVS